jgi:translocation protein SEC62
VTGSKVPVLSSHPALYIRTLGFFTFTSHFQICLEYEHITMSAEEPQPQSGPPQGEPAQGGPPPGALPINIQGPNGEQPTPEQIRQIQMQLAAEAEKHGISIQEYVQRLRQQAMAQQQAQMQAQMQAQQEQQQQQAQPIQPGPPKPEALAVANWLKSQDLKPRTVVHDEKRKDMFKGQKRFVFFFASETDDV